MNYINFLNDITKDELERRKKERIGTTPINLKTDRFILKLLTTLSIIDMELQEHIHQWENECKDSKVPFFKNLWLKQCLNLVDKIKPHFNYIASEDEAKEVKRVTQQCYKEIAAMDIKKNYIDDDMSVNADVEKETLPKDFFDVFCKLMFSMEYLKKHLLKAFDKAGIRKEIDKLLKVFSYYEKAFEKDYIVAAGFNTNEDYNSFKDRILNKIDRNNILAAHKFLQEIKNRG